MHTRSGQKKASCFAKEKGKADKDWDAFLAKNKLPKTSAENLSALQEQWQKIYSAEGKGKILDLRLEQMDARLDAYSRRAESIISKTKILPPLIRTASRSSTRKRMRAA